MDITFIKILLPATAAFAVGMTITPFVTSQLYKHKVWKKKSGKGAGYGGGGTPIFDEIHKEKDTNTPRMGGIVIWASVCLVTLLFILIEIFFPTSAFAEINFFSREQTWLPLFALLMGALIGFIDDFLLVRERGSHFAGGLPLSVRMGVVFLTSLICGWWFYDKLDVSSVSLLSFGELSLGVWFIPFFVFVAICVYMSSVIDGIDGLSGGTFLFIFTAYTAIAFYQGQYDIAALCATLIGGILAFLWFNIPPARFYMTETGIMALTMCLTVIAFMTDTLGEGEGVSVLPIVGFLLLATVAVNTIQIISKKCFGRKVFAIAPLHHLFESWGWPSYKVTMRYWILGFVFAVIGVLLVVAW